MQKITLKDLSQKHRVMDLVHQEKLHISLDSAVSIYCSDIFYDGKETGFYLFLDDEYIFNPVSFPSSISLEDKVAIAKEMTEQYRATCNFEELDMELKGEVPCGEFKGVYSNCNECSRLTGINETKDDGCLGVTFSTSNSFCSLEIQNKWKEKYGENSEAHKNHLTKQLSWKIHEFGFACGEDEKCLEKAVKSLFEHGKINEELLKKVINDCINE